MNRSASFPDASASTARRTWTPWIILAVGLTLTAMVGTYVAISTHELERMRFERWVQDATADVDSRIEKYVAVLEGVAGLFVASEHVSHDEFAGYIRRLNFDRLYPGVQGIGFTLRVRAEERHSVEEQLRRRHENFEIWPGMPREEYHSIIFLEPQDARNREAIGYDMFTEPRRRAAMERARDTGRPAMTAKVTLVQEITPVKQPGFLLYAPVYRGPMPETIEARREGLIGFAYSPFRAHDLLHRIFSPGLTRRVAVRVFDGMGTDPQSQLFESEAADETRDPRFYETRTIRIAGRPWTIAYASRRGFHDSRLPFLLAPVTIAAGVVVSLLLFAMTLAQARAQQRTAEVAVRLARSERALRASDDRLRMALHAGDLFAFSWDLHSNAVYRAGDDGRILGCDPATGDGYRQLVHPEDRRQFQQAFIHSAAGLPHEMEFRIIRPDGEVRWLRDSVVVEHDSDGVPRRVVGICADITRQKLTENQLRALNETLEQRVAERTLEAEQRSTQLRALAVELTQAEHRERRRLAQVLHDHLQQLLVASMMRMTRVSRRVQTEEVRASLQQVEDLIRQAIDASRSLTIELSPPVLYDAGLARGLEWLARSMEEKHGLVVELEVDPEADSEDEDLRAFLFQAVRELLFNAVKHAQVDRAMVRVEWDEQQWLRITVADRGAGFEPSVLRVKGAKAEHFGLFSIQQRLELLGGEMEVRSRPGEGTRIIMRVPPGAKEAAAEEGAAAPPVDDLPESDLHEAADKLLQSYLTAPSDEA